MCNLCTDLREIKEAILALGRESDAQNKLLEKLAAGKLQQVFSVKEAADFLRLNANTVSEYLRAGKIKGMRTDGTDGVWRVTRESLESFLNEKTAA